MPRETPLRVAVNGAAGRMGRMVIADILEHDDLTLVGAADRPGHPDAGRDAGALCGKWSVGVALGEAGPDTFADAEVVVDFSLPGGTLALLEVLTGQALVTGTTGLEPAHMRFLDDYAKRAPVVRASNFSIGVNLLLGLVAQAAALAPRYDVEIVEMHHRHKRDAPSGTALALGAAVAGARGVALDTVGVHGRSGETGPRSQGEIGLHALRGGDVIGEHTVYLAGPGERLMIGHLATSREAFASGALRAALWVEGRPAGLYDMRDVLGMR